ncbi:MAG TPA: toxin-antitoxin system HicB family antitoxin [Verrucomicrobiae bacterium]|nr:toxin-antitoxin system HicB family antitoxin [Verrucomicrobiae bacterium]
MSALTVNLPDNLHEKAREIAASKNLSMDALVSIALAQSLSRLVADPHLEERAARATAKGLDEFLAQVPNAKPQELDHISKDYKAKE